MSSNAYDSTTAQRNSAYAGNASSSDILRQILVVIAVAITIFVNYLATALPLNGRDTGAISDSFPVRFTPAGYVFSIWGVIYLGLIAYAIYQALPGQRTNPRLRAIFGPFMLSSIANSSWIFTWHYGLYPLSVLVILLLLGSLITLYARLYPSFATVTNAERWTTHIPFRIYLGWATVATIANVTILLYDLGWRGAPLTAELWAVILLVIGSAIGLFFALRLRDAAYTLVLVWAFVGIYVKQSDATVVAYTALGLAAVLGLAALVALFSGNRQRDSLPV